MGQIHSPRRKVVVRVGPLHKVITRIGSSRYLTRRGVGHRFGARRCGSPRGIATGRKLRYNVIIPRLKFGHKQSVRFSRNRIRQRIDRITIAPSVKVVTVRLKSVYIK